MNAFNEEPWGADEDFPPEPRMCIDCLQYAGHVANCPNAESDDEINTE